MRERTHERLVSTRRTFLAGLGVAGTGASIGTASAREPPGPTKHPSGRGRRTGFPPARHTEWSDSESLGDGEVRTFVTTSPAGRPTFVGVHLTAGVVEGLDPEEGMELVSIRFPDVEELTPFEWLGLDWMPDGHGPPEVYGVPHFDVHFYLDTEDEIGEIEGVNFPPDESDDDPYEVRIAADQVPPDYFRTNYVVPAMGEHLFDALAPEWDGPGVPSDEAFTHSFVWGHYDGDLNFFEPMITREYLRGLAGEDAAPIRTPERFPEAGEYPTQYAIRYHSGEEAYTVTLEGFEPFEASNH